MLLANAVGRRLPAFVAFHISSYWQRFSAFLGPRKGCRPDMVRSILLEEGVVMRASSGHYRKTGYSGYCAFTKRLEVVTSGS